MTRGFAYCAGVQWGVLHTPAQGCAVFDCTPPAQYAQGCAVSRARKLLRNLLHTPHTYARGVQCAAGANAPLHTAHPSAFAALAMTR